MKNTLIVIVLGLVAIVGTCFVWIRTGEQKNAKAEIAARKAEADQRKASLSLKAAAAERDKALAEKIRAEKTAAAAAADAKAEADRKAAAELELKAAAEHKRAEEIAAKRAADERDAADATAAAAAAKAKTAADQLAIVAATNQIRQAELEIATDNRLRAEADARGKAAELEAVRLKKLDLDRRLAEVAELQETLRQREEASRPERTIKDIMNENERRRAAEEAAAAEAEERRLAELREKDMAAYNAEMERRRKINREGVAGPKARELTAAEKMLVAAEAELDRADGEGRAAIRRRITARLEPDVRAAIADGRKADAEFLLNCLMALNPDYDASRLKRPDGK